MNAHRLGSILQGDYEDLISNPKSSLIIITTPRKNNHPKGNYTIPNKEAREFIESKQETHN